MFRVVFLLAALYVLSGCGFSDVWVDAFYVSERPDTVGVVQIHQGVTERFAFGLTRTEIEGESRFASKTVEADPARLAITDTGELYCPPRYDGNCLRVWELRGIVRGDVPLKVTSESFGWPAQTIEQSTIVHVLAPPQ